MTAASKQFQRANRILSGIQGRGIVIAEIVKGQLSDGRTNEEESMSEKRLRAYEYRKHARTLLKRIAGEYEKTASALEGADAMNKAVLRPDKAKSGKIEYSNPPNQIPASMACRFFKAD